MQYQRELHQLRQHWTVIIGGIETGNIELALKAIRDAEGVLNAIRYGSSSEVLLLSRTSSG